MSEVSFEDIISLMDIGDENIKILGNIISNPSSRKIYMHLFEHEESPANISKILGIDLALVSKYLSLMYDIRLVTKIESHTIRNKKISKYTAKKIIILSPPSAIKRIKNSKNILRELKKSLKLLSLFIVLLSPLIFFRVFPCRIS